MTPTLRDKLERCKTLPTLPTMSVTPLRQLERQNFDVGELGRAVGGDPALPPRLLRFANLLLADQKREAGSLAQAFIWLGGPASCHLALALVLVRELRKAERPGFDHAFFWRRSVTAVVAMRVLARSAGLGKAEDALVAALLQDIGMLALAQALPESFPELFVRGRPNHDRLVEQEKTDLGGSHAEVSGWLLQRWRFPAHLVELVGLCHPDGTPSRRHDEKLAKSLALSGALADLFVAEDPAPAAQAALELGKLALGLAPAAVLDLCTQMAAQLADAETIFEMPLLAPEALAARSEEIRKLCDPNAAPAAVELPRPKVVAVDAGLDEDARERLINRYDPQFVESCLRRLLQDAERAKKPLSVAICDVDQLTRINAATNRDAGDRLLRGLGQWLRMRLRGRDVAARFEGGGFLLVLVDTPIAGAELVSERIRGEVETLGFEAGIGRPLSCTLSIGCTARDDAGSAADLIAHALLAMKAAKAAGRNRVMVYGPTGPRATPLPEAAVAAISAATIPRGAA